MIGILDYGMGNLKSVQNSLSYLGLENQIIASSSHFDCISHLIIPGVGAFPKAMERIQSMNFLDSIRSFADSGKPILGICLGMQLLADLGTEVENCDGLGLIPGSIELMKPNGLRIPHIGWNALNVRQSISLLDQVKKTADVYFVHSYHFNAKDENNIVATTPYGEDVVSIVRNSKGNVIGTQFHPEKSQKQGLKMLENFSRMESC